MPNSKYKRRILVKKSNIKNAGLGVFANVPFKKGSFIGIYKGKRYDINNLSDDDKELLTNSAYAMLVYDSSGNVSSYIDSSEKNKHLSNWTRYINGCKLKKQKPNVGFVTKNTRVHIEVIRDIEVGEELLADYGPLYKW